MRVFFLTWNSDVDNFKTVWQMWIRLCVMCCVVQRVRVEINNVKMKSVTKCGEKLKICYSCNCVLWRRWWCVLIIVSMNKVNRSDIDMRKKNVYAQAWISTRTGITIKNSVDNAISINPFRRRCRRRCCRFSPFDFFIFRYILYFSLNFLRTLCLYSHYCYVRNSYTHCAVMCCVSSTFSVFLRKLCYRYKC